MYITYDREGTSMVEIFYTDENGSTVRVEEPCRNCWIKMTAPTEDEIRWIQGLYQLEDDDIRAALDEEESSRIEVEDNYTLVLADIPTVEERNGKNRYVTIPLGMILVKDEAFITVCLEDSSVLDMLNMRRANKFSTHFRTRLLLQILFRDAQLYLRYLRSINKQSEEIEKNLQGSTENSALIDMMELGKSLLFFMTSLKAMQSVLQKVLNTSSIKKYEDDQEFLEEVMVECSQALEMSEIYNGILNGMMDAYASIISNNMNVVMKVLAVATIVLSIPNIVFGAYGMNLAAEGMPLAKAPYAFYIIIALSVVLSLLVLWYLDHKKMY